MTLDYMRDKLIKEGWDQIIAFDESSSATLVKDNQTLSRPDNYKNNTAIGSDIICSATIIFKKEFLSMRQLYILLFSFFLFSCRDTSNKYSIERENKVLVNEIECKIIHFILPFN